MSSYTDTLRDARGRLVEGLDSAMGAGRTDVEAIAALALVTIALALDDISDGLPMAGRGH